jgi:hypothetical protein
LQAVVITDTKEADVLLASQWLVRKEVRSFQIPGERLRDEFLETVLIRGAYVRN